MSWVVFEQAGSRGRQVRVAWTRGADGRVWFAWGGASHLLPPAGTAVGRAPQHAAPAPGAAAVPTAPQGGSGVRADAPQATLHGPQGGGQKPSEGAVPPGCTWAVRAPAAGRLGALRVAVGQKVAAGEVVATLEAMKVEVPVSAAQAGEVGALPGLAGSWVEAGQVLVGLK